MDALLKERTIAGLPNPYRLNRSEETSMNKQNLRLSLAAASIVSTMMVAPVPAAADGLTGYGGLDHGYILRFSNGLVVYLTGDTGHFGDMKHIVRDFYGPKLMVVNLGNGPSMGPEEGSRAEES